MGHPIHKHMGGMKSAERYDAKEAYNKDLSSKARMHYLENDIADKKGMSRQASPLDAIGAHSMKPGDYASHLASASEHKAPSDKERKGRKHKSDKQPSNTPPKAGMSRYSDEEGMSRKASPLNGFNNYTSDTHKHPHAEGTSRKSSPANNVSYGDKSGKTGYIGEAKYDMKYNAVDDITQGKGKADYGMSRQSSPLNGHGYHAKKKK